jgi:hypothetical protein
MNKLWAFQVNYIFNKNLTENFKLNLSFCLEFLNTNLMSRFFIVGFIFMEAFLEQPITTLTATDEDG